MKALAVLVLISALPGVGEAACREVQTVPVQITRSGVYCLRQDLAAQLEIEEAAIVVAADAVVLDLGGFTLSGHGGFGVRATGRREVTVRNGAIRGFRRGVFLEGTGGLHLVEGLTTESKDEGLRIEGTGNLVRRNTIARHGNGPGLVVSGALARILGNEVASASGHSSTAISLLHASGSIVEGNRISGTPRPGSVGVAVSSGDDVLLLDNDLRAAEQGIVFERGSRGLSHGNLEAIGGTDAR
jgi:hypothetical protein